MLSKDGQTREDKNKGYDQAHLGMRISSYETVIGEDLVKVERGLGDERSLGYYSGREIILMKQYLLAFALLASSARAESACRAHRSSRERVLC